MERIYGYYCPVAHALGTVGERWSLLIVRDLLNEPKRFTDLLGRLGNITPKGLTLRLRQLETAGIVARMKGKDRREAWYQLTTAGKELQPVIEALRTWGLRNAMRTPLPGEVVHPDLAMGTLAASLNHRRKTLSRPSQWLFRFTPGLPFTLAFDGNTWTLTEGEGENPEVTLSVSPETWAAFLAVKRTERAPLARRLHLTGKPEGVSEFKKIFGVTEEITGP